MKTLRNIIQKITKYETMSGNGVCPIYLERWTLLELFGCAVYLHRFLGDDWAKDPHDHPRRFISIGLWGWYWEDMFRPAQRLDVEAAAREEGVPAVDVTELIHSKRYSAPWFRSFPAEHLHRVRASECGNTWTLVIVLPKSRRWGFVQDGKWVAFKDYVFGGKFRKDC
jgi:hypothetical protein